MGVDDMKVLSKTTKRMVLGASYILTAGPIRASGEMIKWMATASSSIPMAKLHTKGIG
jgi:hypothetical protein